MDFVKKYFKAILVIAFLFVSVGAFNMNVPIAQAATAAELQALIAQLQAQIANLQKQLAEIRGEPAVWCHDFNRNLKFGNGGSEVIALQTALRKQGFYGYPATQSTDTEGNFGIYTSSAVVGFQEKYKETVLAPWGLAHGTGFVGTTTREKLNQLYDCGVISPVKTCDQICKSKGYISGVCRSWAITPTVEWGCKEGEVDVGKTSDCSVPYGMTGIGKTCCCKKEITGNLPPVVDGLSAPTQLKVDEKGTWIIKAHDPENGQLTYNVNWGDENIIKPLSSSLKGTQATSFTHSYSEVGNYTIRFTVTDDQGQTAKTSTTVKVVSTTCHTTPLWSWDYCSSGCKCYAGEGDCDTDADCLTGYCAHDVGAKYGQVSSMDVCEEKLTVLSPDGGEEWIIGKTYTIKWSASPHIAKVDISVRKEGATYFTFVDRNVVASTGQYNWEVDVSSGKYKVYIETTPDWGPSAHDYGDDYFSIVSVKPSITVISPNGGERWMTGQTYDIIWDCPDEAEVDMVDIFIKDKRVSDEWITPIKSLIKCSLEKYSWKIGDISSGENCFKIQLRHVAGSQPLIDESDNYFSIVEATPSITVLSPNGGERWVTGQTYDITWESTGIEKINIWLNAKDNTTESIDIAILDASLGKYSYAIPSFVTPGDYKISILTAKGYSPYVYDYSDDYFSILLATMSCTDSDHNSGNVFYTKGTITTDERTYTDQCIDSDNLKEYFCTSGYGAAETFLCPNGCKDGACISEPSITVITPNGGEKWEIGKTYTVEFKTSGVNKVDIYLDNWEGVVAGEPKVCTVAKDVSTSNGEYSWIINDCPNNSGNYFKIMIKDVRSLSQGYSQQAFDYSDNYFSIVESGVGLFDIENQLASLADIIAQMAEKLKELMKK